MESINEKIKRIRIEIGINQADVARSAGIKQSSYASIEKGDTKSISIEVGKGIAKALRISFNELFDIENADNKNNLQEEIEKLKKTIESLEEQLDDKRQLNLAYKNTIDFLKLFLKFSLDEFTEIDFKNSKISTKDFITKVEDRIRNEIGDFTYVADELALFTSLKISK